MPEITIDLRLVTPMDKIIEKITQATGQAPVVRINREKRIVFTANLTRAQVLALRDYVRNMPPYNWDFDYEVS